MQKDHSQSSLTSSSPQGKATDVSDAELLRVIADFLEMGHVENIVAMFKQEPRYYQWVGTLLTDERFAVRLGVSVLFEYLKEERPSEIASAIPSLAAQLAHREPWVRGEVLSVLAIIGTKAALDQVRAQQQDPSPQVQEIIRDILEDQDDA